MKQDKDLGHQYGSSSCELPAFKKAALLAETLRNSSSCWPGSPFRKFTVSGLVVQTTGTHSGNSNYWPKVLQVNDSGDGGNWIFG